MTVSRRQRAALQRLRDHLAKDAALLAELGIESADSREPALAA
jgi:hypothetical protein